MRVAYFSPLPPARSGIADYSEALIESLRPLVDLEVFSVGLQQHWTAATDVLSSALLLQRLTGMRIGECVDLVPDCLRHLGDNRWSLHVPHGKPRSERWVPVDDPVRVVVERLTFLRTLPPAADPQFLLARPKGRDVLLAS